MSGGHWNYEDGRLIMLQDDLYGDITERLKEDVSYFSEYELSVLTMVSSTALRLMGLLRVHMHRLDYLYSGDDGFDTFEQRMREDILRENSYYMDIESELRELLQNRLKKFDKDKVTDNDDAPTN